MRSNLLVVNDFQQGLTKSRPIDTHPMRGVLKVFSDKKNNRGVENVFSDKPGGYHDITAIMNIGRVGIQHRSTLLLLTSDVHHTRYMFIVGTGWAATLRTEIFNFDHSHPGSGCHHSGVLGGMPWTMLTMTFLLPQRSPHLSTANQIRSKQKWWHTFARLDVQDGLLREVLQRRSLSGCRIQQGWAGCSGVPGYYPGGWGLTLTMFGDGGKGGIGIWSRSATLDSTSL